MSGRIKMRPARLVGDADTFREVGGFPPLAVMEDYALVRRLRRSAVRQALRTVIWMGLVTIAAISMMSIHFGTR